MRVISFIEDQDVIKKIPKCLGLWEVNPKPTVSEGEISLFHEPPSFLVGGRANHRSIFLGAEGEKTWHQ
jgi:hypothetical protein